MVTLARSRPGPLAYFQVRLGGWICLPASAPTPLSLLFRQQAEVSLPRPRVAACGSCGMLTASSICLAFRLIIRGRLTPGRLTSPGNPWSCGGGGSRSPYRYLCLHLLFHALHRGSRLRLRRACNAPLPMLTASRGFGAQLDTRLLSMPDPSTSELLRTL